MKGRIMKALKPGLVLLIGAAMSLPVSPAVAQAFVPDEKILGDVTFVTGGARPEEAAALRRAAAEYPLAVGMWAKNAAPGEYVANAQVEIRDAQDNVVFNTVVDGPILLARLTPGVYTVVARWKGTMKEQSVDLTRSGTEQVLLEFPQ
jgi:hypothetical protein